MGQEELLSSVNLCELDWLLPFIGVIDYVQRRCYGNKTLIVVEGEEKSGAKALRSFNFEDVGSDLLVGLVPRHGGKGLAGSIGRHRGAFIEIEWREGQRRFAKSPRGHRSLIWRRRHESRLASSTRNFSPRITCRMLGVEQESPRCPVGTAGTERSTVPNEFLEYFSLALLSLSCVWRPIERPA